jgi:hypothetical protein
MSAYFYFDSSFTPKVAYEEVLKFIKDEELSIEDYVSQYDNRISISIDDDTDDPDGIVDAWTDLVKHFADWTIQETVRVVEQCEDQNETVTWYLGPGRNVLKSEITEIEEEIERLEKRLVKKKALMKKASMDIKVTGDAEREDSVTA